MFQFHDTNRLGVYDVRRGDQVIERFAVNLFDRQESDVRVRPNQDKNGISVNPADIRIGNVDVAATVGQTPTRIEAWKPVSRAPCSCWYWNGISTTVACTSDKQRIMDTKQKKRGIGALNRIVENDFIHRVSADEYREKVKDVYGGRQGALLATASHLSMHVPLGRRLFRTRKFDLRGMKSILDVGSGAGQIAGHLLDFSDPEARITCIDISQPMLRRARSD